MEPSWMMDDGLALSLRETLGYNDDIISIIPFFLGDGRAACRCQHSTCSDVRRSTLSQPGQKAGKKTNQKKKKTAAKAN